MFISPIQFPYPPRHCLFLPAFRARLSPIYHVTRVYSPPTLSEASSAQMPPISFLSIRSKAPHIFPAFFVCYAPLSCCTKGGTGRPHVSHSLLAGRSTLFPMGSIIHRSYPRKPTNPLAAVCSILIIYPSLVLLTHRLLYLARRWMSTDTMSLHISSSVP